MLEKTSDEYYTETGPFYLESSKSRSNYIKAVDSIVLAAAKKNHVEEWLDIGTGNGKRLNSLMKKINLEKVVCLEPSLYMFQEASQSLNKNCTLINKSLSQYSSESDSQFSLVTALWNVIGHSEDPIEFLQDAYRHLNDNGVLLIDANNRYNIKQYGLFSVARNIISDFLGLGSKGVFTLKATNLDIFTRVYIANPHEIHEACKKLNDAHYEVKYINYATGANECCLTGQILVKIFKKRP